MSENSKIEWTDHTFNPWVGCTKVSPGCDHCYAESWAKRTGNPRLWSEGLRRRTTPENWRKPIKWNAECAANGMRAKVFCASLADVFDNEVDPQWRADLFYLIHNTPHLDWLLLTKRIGNARSMIEGALRTSGLLMMDVWPWPNVWIGATIVNREEMLRDAPKLKQVPARVHFWSYEPALGALGEIPADLMPEWVICGGESGGNARPMQPAWALQIREQCVKTRTAFFFKQGSAANWPEFKNFDSFPSDLQLREWPAP